MCVCVCVCVCVFIMNAYGFTQYIQYYDCVNAKMI